MTARATPIARLSCSARAHGRQSAARPEPLGRTGERIERRPPLGCSQSGRAQSSTWPEFHCAVCPESFRRATQARGTSSGGRCCYQNHRYPCRWSLHPSPESAPGCRAFRRANCSGTGWGNWKSAGIDATATGSGWLGSPAIGSVAAVPGDSVAVFRSERGVDIVMVCWPGG